MKYAVDSIVDDIAVLEELETKEKRRIKSSPKITFLVLLIFRMIKNSVYLKRQVIHGKNGYHLHHFFFDC